MTITLAKYIVKNYIKSFIVVFLCFFAIVSLMELMDTVRQYFSGGYDPSAIQIIKITFCRATVTICTFFSFLVLFATVVFYTTMHNRFEISIIKGASISPYRILQMLFIAVSILSIFYISVFDTLSVYAYRIQDIKIAQKQSAERNLMVTSKGIWFRDVCDNKSYIISAKNFDHIGTSLNNARFFEFDKQGNLLNIFSAQIATIKDGTWQMQHCKIITREGNSIEKVNHTFPTKLSYKKINKMVADPHSISFWNMHKFVNLLNRVGLSSMHYKMHWFSRIATILQMFAFITIASAFCISHNYRNHKTYIRKASALVALAFPLHFVNNIILAYGENGAIPLSISVFALPMIIFVAGLLFLNEE